MPVNRRRSAAQIAKVNARSIDGFFGVGTDCFFIRGTVLSDVHVEGEYRTLTIQRPGNVIEVEAFDGEWATVSVVTRSGNRPGDNVRARLFLRDTDLRTVGIDCSRIMSGVDVFEQPAQADPFIPWIAEQNGTTSAPAGGFSFIGSEPLHRPVEPPAEPLLSLVPDPEPIPAAPARDWLAFATRSLLVDGRLFVEIGVSMIAIALPVVLYFLRELLSRRDDG